MSHLDERGRAQMVDVGSKPVTERTAVARARVCMQPRTFEMLKEGNIRKGDALAVARVAGVMAAKQTPYLVPLCHPLNISGVRVRFLMDPERSALEVEAEIKTVGRTGAEMEALTAVSIAALTIYDMCKAVDKGMVIEAIRLIHKSGGKSGGFHRPGERIWHQEEEG